MFLHNQCPSGRVSTGRDSRGCNVLQAQCGPAYKLHADLEAGHAERAAARSGTTWRPGASLPHEVHAGPRRA